MRRREFLKLAAGAGAGSVGMANPAVVGAQAAWPEKPIKFIVPFAAGGATDLIARPWAEQLSKAFKQQVVIENRGGASGLIGAEATFRSAPDGYTFLFSSNSTTVFQPQLRKINYDPKQFVLVGRMGDSISGFIVHPKHGFKTLKELIDFAKKNPGKLTFGSSGPGTTTHLRLEMLKLKAGIDILHVPYRGNADALNDLLANNVQMMNEINPMPHVRAGKLTLLDISHTERHPDFPDVPTLFEHGYGEAYVPSWYALWAPAGTPPAIIEKLNGKMIEIGRSPQMKSLLLGLNVAIAPQTPAEMARHLEVDTARTADLIKLIGLKAE